MSTAAQRILDLPATVSIPELHEHPIRKFEPRRFDEPGFDEKQLVTIYGYIGLVKPHEYLYLHQTHDYRAFFKVPIEGVFSAEPDLKGSLKNLYVLRIHRDVPLRYFYATTADLSAGTLADAIELFNDIAKKPQHQKHPIQPDQPIDPCAKCGQGCCRNDNCVCLTPSLLLCEAFAKLLGYEISKPKD